MKLCGGVQVTESDATMKIILVDKQGAGMMNLLNDRCIDPSMLWVIA